MPDFPELLLTRRNITLMLCLFVLLAGVYWLTYSGELVSTDEVFIFDAAESLARRGNTELNLSAHLRLFREYPVGEQPHAPIVNAEPMQVIAAALLFRLAEALPGIGLLHTVWLLNVLVCAAGGAVFFLYARLLKYSERAAILGALIYGLGTITWPYSKTLFREPLAMLLLFSAALCLSAWLERWHWLRGWVWLGGFALVYLLALLTKEVALLIIPTLLALAMPRLALQMTRRRLLLAAAAVAGIVALTVVVISVLLAVVPGARSYDPMLYLRSLGEGRRFIGYALAGYLFSPGRSLFAFSPVLLLGLPGLWLLGRARRWREAALPILAVLTFIVGYAVIRNADWFGGQAWGPRFLVPITLFAVLPILPVLESVLKPGVSRRARWPVWGIITFSVLVQLNGTLPSSLDYFREIARRGVIAWEGGTWDWQHVPLAVNPGLLFSRPLDLAWRRAEDAGAWLPLAALLLIGAAAAGLWFWCQKRRTVSGRGLAITAVALLAALGGAFYVGLRSIYNDPRYLGGFAPLHELMATLDAQARPDDILILPNPTYLDFFYNYYRNREVLFFSLPTQVGEQPSPEQPPAVVDSNLDRLLEPRYSIFLTNLPEYTDRVWLLNNTGPFTSYAVRPVEWFLARHYFPLAEYRAGEGDSARLVLFEVNSDAPSGAALRWPYYLTDARFGEEVALVGYEVPPPRLRVGPFDGPDPQRTTYAPGEVVPLSLLWRALTAPASDYNVAALLINAEGGAAAQHDSAPQGGFMPMNRWQPGQTVWDNHALQLPPELPSGEYTIWVRVYAWQTGEALPVSGEDSAPDGRAALLTTIRVDG